MEKNLENLSLKVLENHGFQYIWLVYKNLMTFCGSLLVSPFHLNKIKCFHKLYNRECKCDLKQYFHFHLLELLFQSGQLHYICNEQIFSTITKMNEDQFYS